MSRFGAAIDGCATPSSQNMIFLFMFIDMPTEWLRITSIASIKPLKYNSLVCIHHQRYWHQISPAAPRRFDTTEEVDADRVFELKEKIVQSGYWKVPITVHKDALFVMDGHHRLTVETP